jgi:hypothetical protein
MMDVTMDVMTITFDVEQNYGTIAKSLETRVDQFSIIEIFQPPATIDAPSTHGHHSIKR